MHLTAAQKEQGRKNFLEVVSGTPSFTALAGAGPAGPTKGGPVKAALRKGGLVIKNQAIQNIEAIVAKPDEDGYVSTGTLAKSVAVSRDPKPQKSGANERYRVHVLRQQRGHD